MNDTNMTTGTSDINYDEITIDDAMKLFYQGKRLVINDGNVIDIIEEA